MNTLLKQAALAALVGSLAFGGSLLAAGAADNFETHCAKCHGADGKGQTKVGKKLNVRDMTSAAFKKDFDEAKAFSSVKDGIKKDGKEIKKAFGAELSDAEIKALIAYVKGLN